MFRCGQNKRKCERNNESLKEKERIKNLDHLIIYNPQHNKNTI